MIAANIPISVFDNWFEPTAKAKVARPTITIKILEHFTSSSIGLHFFTRGRMTVAEEDKKVEKLDKVAEQVAIKKIPVKPFMSLKWSFRKLSKILYAKYMQ